MTRFNLHLCFLALVNLTLSMCVFASAPVKIARTPAAGAVPDAEIGADGKIHVAYVSGEDAYYITSTDSGNTFSKPLRINSEPASVHPANMFRGPDLVLGKEGRLHVIWYVNSYQRKLPHDQWGVFYAHLDQGQSAFSNAVNLNRKPSDNYSLAADSKGNVAVIWMAGNLFVTPSTDNGQTFAAAHVVSNADPCECCASRALFSPTGSLMINYREKTSNIRDMHLLVRAPGTGPFSNIKLSGTVWEIAACPMTGTFLSGSQKDIAAAWETKNQIFYARLDASSGKLKTKEIKASDSGKWPVVLVREDGSILVSWKNESKLRWQQFDQHDRPLGNAGQAESPNSTRHAGVVTKDGHFILID